MNNQLATFLATALLSCAAFAQPAPDVRRAPSDVQSSALLNAQQRPRIGLVLSGGGARGLAHIGVLKVLHELNVPVDVIAATSMGAIVGGSYAAGYTSEQLEHLVRTIDWVEIFSRRAPREALHFRRKEDDYRNLSDLEFGITRNGLTLPRGAVAAQNLGLFLRKLGGPVQEVNDLAQLPIPFAAVATDLASGQPVVLQRGVSLAAAMRASTSLPGAFAPFEYQGRALVDGALVSNLPVDVARVLGAHIVIVVNAGTPLAPREKVTDVLSVTEQVFNILTEQNVERTLAGLHPNDILIRPELGDFGVSDFQRAAQIMQAGEAAARAVADRLRALAVPPAQFAAYEEARVRPVREEQPRIIHRVRIEGLRTVNPEAVRSELNVPLDKPVSADDLSRAVQRIYGWGDFEAVSYSVVQEQPQERPQEQRQEQAQEPPRSAEDRESGAAASRDGRTLVVTPFEKSWGYNTLRFGGNVQSNFRDDNTFNLLAAHTWAWLNGAGGEWRNEVQIGELRRLGTEFYQPFSPGSHWFALPRIWAQREKFDAFSGRQSVARFENVTRTAELQLGYAIGLLGSVRAGYGWSRTQTRVLIGPTVIAPQKSEAATASLEVMLDTLDNISFPHRGYVVTSRYRRYDSPVGSLERNESITLDTGMPLTFGRYTVLFNAHGASEVQEGAFKIGGLFNLSGTPYGAIAGSRGLVLRAQGYRNVSDAFGDLRVPTYAGFSIETGNAFASNEPVRWSKRRHAFAGYVGADTPVGPLYLAVGKTVGGASGFYLLWGRPQ